MLQLRPTFSESWYRVANLRAKLRSSTQISRQYYRGERWYVVRDPAGNQFHRLSDAAYRFVGLLDGSRTVEEAWDLVGGQLADDAPTQPEVIQILSQLHSANLLEADIPADAGVLLRRHKMLMKRQLQGRLMNLLFPRIPIWDPDSFLKKFLPVARVFLSWWGAILWVVVVIAACAVVAPRLELFKLEFSNAIDPNNWIWLWIVFVLLKFIHELGHAFACRRFGGEVHEMGIMFLVFIPTPYVDASSAWAFPSRWARMFVGAGGMIVEIFIAGILVFVWAGTNDNSLIHKLAFNGIWWASVTTVLFNANPLLRYDGYYMLSDWLEIPNLRQRSSEYLMGLIKRHVFRIKATQPLPPIKQRVWLFTYGITSTIYRTFIGVVIILMVAYRVPVLGMLMAIGGVITWLVVPTSKLFNYLTLSPELHRKRGRAWLFTGAVATAVILLIGVLRFPVQVSAEGVIDPAKLEAIRATSDGYVVAIAPGAADGVELKAGDPILILENDQLQAELKKVTIDYLATLKKRDFSVSVDPTSQKLFESQAATYEKLISELNRKIDALTIRAPIAGKLIAPDLLKLGGRFLTSGDQVASIGDMSEFVVKAVVDQSDAQLAEVAASARKAELEANINNLSAPEIRLVGNLGKLYYGRSPQVLKASQPSVPHAALTQAGGGTEANDPKDESGTRPQTEQFELRVTLIEDEPSVPALRAGQRAYVKIEYQKETLLWQWSRRFWQLIQKQNQSKGGLV